MKRRASTWSPRSPRQIITAGWRTPPPGTAGSTLRLSRSPSAVCTASSGRDERLLVRAGESSRYSESKGRASRPRHAAVRCDRRAAVMERVVWGRHFCLRRRAQTGMSAPLSTHIETCRHLSPRVDLEDEDEDEDEVYQCGAGIPACPHGQAQTGMSAPP